MCQAVGGAHGLGPPPGADCLPKRKRRVFSRGRELKVDSYVIILANVTSGENVMHLPEADLILAQEMRVSHLFVGSLLNRIGVETGLLGHVNPSVITEAGGLSAGVAVFAKPCRPTATLPGFVETPPSLLAERAVFRIASGLLPRGTLVCSLYLFT